jgi:Rrf2 family protein
MKLSTKSRNALEGMLYIAVYGENRLVNTREIAAKLKISPTYMEQIFYSLKKSGLVTTVRGSKGGFALGLDDEKITVGMIIRAIDGSMVPVKCVKNIASCKSQVRSNCLSRNVWVKITHAILEVADKLTLKDLKDKYLAERGVS